MVAVVFLSLFCCLLSRESNTEPLAGYDFRVSLALNAFIMSSARKYWYRTLKLIFFIYFQKVSLKVIVNYVLSIIILSLLQMMMGITRSRLGTHLVYFPLKSAGVWQSEHSSTAWYKEADCSYCPFTRRGNQARVCQCTTISSICWCSFTT